MRNVHEDDSALFFSGFPLHTQDSSFKNHLLPRGMQSVVELQSYYLGLLMYAARFVGFEFNLYFIISRDATFETNHLSVEYI